MWYLSFNENLKSHPTGRFPMHGVLSPAPMWAYCAPLLYAQLSAQVAKSHACEDSRDH